MKHFRLVFTKKNLPRIILAGGCLCLLVLGGILKEQVSREEHELSELRHNARIIHRLQDMVPTESDLIHIPVAEALAQSAGHFGLHPGLTETGDGTVSVSTGALSFDKLVSWLAELQTKYNVQVVQLRVQPEQHGNQVEVKSLVLKRTVTG